ncbi:hypothetical protein FKM82_025170 [Ascaphus truei]
MIPCTLTLLVRAHSTAAVSLTELTANRAKSLPKGPSLKQSQAEGELGSSWGLRGDFWPSAGGYFPPCTNTHSPLCVLAPN